VNSYYACDSCETGTVVENDTTSGSDAGMNVPYSTCNDCGATYGEAQLRLLRPRAVSAEDSARIGDPLPATAVVHKPGRMNPWLIALIVIILIPVAYVTLVISSFLNSP